MSLTLNTLGFSVYVSTFPQQRESLETIAENSASEIPVFISLHISEEFCDSYCKQAEEICRWLYNKRFKIIADVSVKTVAQFGESNLIKLAERLGIWALRIDYGFDEQQIIKLGKQIPVVLNASTTIPEAAARISKECKLVMAMHNFYPRPETGLDENYLRQTTRDLQSAGLKVLAFIPGDKDLRGPIFERLPTLESHRKFPPSVCFADLAVNYEMDAIFLGDPSISNTEYSYINQFTNENTLAVPCKLDEKYSSLYGKIFTCRIDSPSSLVRFQESREYSCFGKTITPSNCIERNRGVITIDNENYGRYSGEIQLLRKNFPKDSRVNVIGKVAESHIDIIDCIKNGEMFVLVKY